jgi:hypothetical protein
LPQVYNVEMIASAEAIQGAFEPVKAGGLPLGAVAGEAKLAYLAPWGTAAAGRLLAGAFREGLKVSSSDKSFDS